MNRQERMKLCRYYKGEEDIPTSFSDLEGLWWIAESSFVDSNDERDKKRIEDFLPMLENVSLSIPLALFCQLYVIVTKAAQGDYFDVGNLNHFLTHEYLAYHAGSTKR